MCVCASAQRVDLTADRTQGFRLHCLFYLYSISYTNKWMKTIVFRKHGELHKFFLPKSDVRNDTKKTIVFKR